MDTRFHRWCVVQAAAFCGIVATIAVMAAVAASSFRAPRHVALLDGSLAKAFETHYEEVFPVKRLGVNLWAAMDYALFGEGLPGVVIGRNDWLYTDEEFNVDSDPELTVRSNLAMIARVKRQLASENVKLVLGVVPTKAEIYPEFLAARKPARIYDHLYDELLASAKAESIPTADLRRRLTDGKSIQLTYFRTDTHWTPWGAKLAATEIAKVVRDIGLLHSSGLAYATHVEAVSSHRGDLLGFLPLEPFFVQLLPSQESIDVMKTEKALPQDHPLHSSSTELFGDAGVPDIVLIGTSYSANTRWNFAGYLKESLSEDIANLAREGAGPFRPMVDYLRSEDFRRKHPRLVIWEIPERALLVSGTWSQLTTDRGRP